MSPRSVEVAASGARSRAHPAGPIVLRGGRVGSRGQVADVRLADGIVAGLGDDAAAETGDEVVDVHGRTVLPGLWDAHVHSMQWAKARRRVDVSKAESARAAATIMAAAHRDRRNRTAATELLVGYGFRDGLWEDRPDKWVLEAVAPGRASMVLSNDLHAAWLSPAALSLVGWEDHPSGVLREGDALRMQAALPGESRNDTDRWVVEAMAAAAARGVTGLTDFEYADNVSDWTRRRQHGPLPVRVACSIYPEYLDEVIGRALRTGAALPGSAGELEVGPVKVFVDGSLNTRTALCADPYPGMGESTEARGLIVTGPAELEGIIAKAAQHGLATAAHAIGDEANRIALDAFGRVGVPGRIEHAQLLHEADVPRFARLGVVAGVQPAHALGDRDIADRIWNGRTGRAFCYAALLAAGARIEIGSDAPVAPLDPWQGIAAAVTRTGDARPPWHPEQAIPLGDALAAASRGKRKIRVGDQADLVIVETDPADVTPSDLAAIPVFGTLVAGRWTHRAA